MAKQSRKSPKKVSAEKRPAKEVKPTLFENTLPLDIAFVFLITVLMVIALKPVVIDGLSPQGVDVLASVGATNQINEYSEESGEKALWNPYIFSGMPRYQRMSPVTISADTVLGFLGRLFNHIFIYYLFGGLGAYFLFRYMKFSPFLSLFGALAFVLIPHYKSLYLEGHFTKFRAIMLLPWIFMSFKYFLNSRTILGAAFFALAFGTQIRTQHYQIVFYTGLMIFAMGIYPILKDLIDRNYQRFIKSAGLVVVATFLAIMSAAQPLFMAKEYLPWSKRGKTTIDINAPKEQSNAKSDGVSLEYATRWSTAPSELLTWVIPRFYGGMSGEKYTGDGIPELKNQVIPGYWGHMPFTQSYEYIGVLTILFALIGIYYNRRNRLIISMLIFSGFLIILSFGRHLEWFYTLWFNYVPFFNKFRAPMMSVTVTSFLITIFAVFGLNSIIKLARKEEDFKWTNFKPVVYIVGGFLVGGLLLWLIGQGFSFIKQGQNFNPQVTEILVEARKEMFNSDMLRYIAFVLLAGIAIFIYLNKKLPAVAFLILIVAISTIDLFNIRTRINKQHVNIEILKNRYFTETATDRFLQKDKELFRIYPYGRDIFGDNRWVYYHQSIGGYSPIKMYTIEEIVENNLNGGTRLNKNIMKILNVKYVVTRGEIKDPGFELVYPVKGSNMYTYLFKDYKKRGFFVGKWINIEDEYERVSTLNSTSFDPDSIAITEEDIKKPINFPDSSNVTVTSFNPNLVEMDVYTDKQSLFVISEVYYPPGWKITVDGDPAEKIYRLNHAIQGIVLPPGNHKVELNFHPVSYYSNVRYAGISLVLIYLVIFGSIVNYFIKRKKGTDSSAAG